MSPPSHRSHEHEYIEPERHDALSSGVPASITPVPAGAQKRAAGRFTPKSAETTQAATKGGSSHKGTTQLSHRIDAPQLTPESGRRARTLRRALSAEIASSVGGGVCGRPPREAVERRAPRGRQAPRRETTRGRVVPSKKKPTHRPAKSKPEPSAAPPDPIAAPYALMSVAALLDYFKVETDEGYQAFLGRFEGLKRVPSQRELCEAKMILHAIDAAVVVGDDESWKRIRKAERIVEGLDTEDALRSRVVELVVIFVKERRRLKEKGFRGGAGLRESLGFVDRAFLGLDPTWIEARLANGERGAEQPKGGSANHGANRIAAELALKCQALGFRQDEAIDSVKKKFEAAHRKLVKRAEPVTSTNR